MSSSTTQTTVNRQRLYRQTLGILNANYLHFIPISLLFLPLAFSASAAIRSYYSSSSSHLHVTTYFDPPTLLLVKTITASSHTLLSVKTLIIILAFTFFVILPTVAGIALITYSANQAVYHKPLTFSSAVKSLSRSYIPLLSTVIAGSIKLILLSLLITLSPLATTEAIKALGFHFDQFIISIFLNTICLYVLALTMLYFIVIWGSAAAISVLESKSGFEPLRQSANQSSEFRSHSFSIVFLSGFATGSVLFAYSAMVQNTGWARNWVSILYVCVISLDSSLMILHYAVFATVLYVQCKVAGAGAGGEECVSVVVGEEEVPHQRAKYEIKGYGGFTCIFYFLCIVWFLITIYQSVTLLFLLINRNK